VYDFAVSEARASITNAKRARLDKFKNLWFKQSY